MGGLSFGAPPRLLVAPTKSIESSEFKQTCKNSSNRKVATAVWGGMDDVVISGNSHLTDI